jgi:REP element-mobilizing transposase RayT
MKQQNKARQALLQKKRTKRNAARKNAVYNPDKLAQRGFVVENSGDVLYDSVKETIVL